MLSRRWYGRQSLIVSMIALVMPRLCAADYVQVDCVTTQSRSADLMRRSVSFALVHTRDKDARHAHRRYVDFGVKGLTLGLPPIYFAPDWSDLTRLILRTHSTADGMGVMEFGLRKKDGNEDLRRIGLVSVKCWNQLTQFVKENQIVVETETLNGTTK